MNFKNLNPFRGRQPGSGTATASPPHQSHPQSPNTGPLPSSGTAGGTSSPHLHGVEGGKINLVNYSPQELMQHVDETLSTVHFGMSAGERFKEGVGEFWDIAGPPVLLAGTAGEVFAFIYNNTTSPAWWVAISILATVIVLEATFMVVSYKSSTIRNRAENKPGGATDLDKAMLRRYRTMWYILAVGVGVGQAAFLISAMDTKMSNLIFLVVFAVLRTIFTLASDYYTAFVHVAKPTSGEEAKAKLEQRADMAGKLLEQKTNEVTIINDGILNLQRAHTKADIEQDTMNTESQVKRLENKNRIDTLRAQAESAAMFSKLGSNMMRALFDPDLPDGQRDKLLGIMQGFMAASKALPSPHVERVEEIDDGDV